MNLSLLNYIFAACSIGWPGGRQTLVQLQFTRHNHRTFLHSPVIRRPSDRAAL